MFARNIGGIDKILRIVVGALMIGAAFIVQGPYHWLLLLGVVPLATGLAGTCPLYSMLGISTRPDGK
ncbi:hypothetical protein AL036_11245 [Salipiger aestuarii]|uniref:Inner membrane protein YgaP-like transmembrane domain-containing protein n=1 Tax=Salipiger aestuarii TaxID=568098 RepID=A0A327YPS9_9RHOB|nr:DUF2892 domain-containing protein [Salipiger aestuarii]EIE50664.1 hypothetical protein C357_12539 [Citreicella sp. 357]KAA8607330.1 hypothetical protein AL036_11245 [Salipiger aestuarii]KAA8612977.1 hypothetical protein AL037_06565 [Salipiger aestuarii]KAB2543756.1 hypothetical protein AL035_00905 [Salipiger aestuarii]RAK23008.1 hypothetical protein ATI53_1002188 [Salipiger aestuarii]